MSVRASLLAILTVGPAYGFQLHGELAVRTAARRRVNVGQIYATLERLVIQAAIESAGTTDDGLPLYRLTPSGRAEALDWLHDTESTVGDEWEDLVDRILIASSLPRAQGSSVHSSGGTRDQNRDSYPDARRIIAANRKRWVARRDVARNGAAVTAQDRLALAAASALAEAALVWLDEAERQLATAEPGSIERGLSEDRPRRGRRPAARVERSSIQ